jgi:hypothetical protein
MKYRETFDEKFIVFDDVFIFSVSEEWNPDEAIGRENVLVAHEIPWCLSA